MRIFAIPNIKVKVLNQKNELPLRNFLSDLKQPFIIIQGHFELTKIDYDPINDEITRREFVDNNNSNGRNL